MIRLASTGCGRMVRFASLAAVIALTAAVPALAEISPTAGEFDARVRTVDYNPMNVVRIVGTPTTSTQIVFSPDEEIVLVAIGDADYWLAQPAGSLLFLKPTEIRPPTNAQVVTRRRDGSTRSYQLLLASHTRTKGVAAYSILFNYPADAAAAVAAARAADAAKAAQIATKLAGLQSEITAQTTLEGAHLTNPRNWRYVVTGSKRIEPAEVFDNGSMTSFRFPGNMRLPTIYTLSPSGEETIVPFSMHGDLAVVQTTAREFRLRDGTEVVRVLNQAFDPIGLNPNTGTKSPLVTRTIRDPKPAAPEAPPEWIKTAPR